MSESIRNAYFSFRTAQPFFPPSPARNFDFGLTKYYWNSADSDGKFVMHPSL